MWRLDLQKRTKVDNNVENGQSRGLYTTYTTEHGRFLAIPWQKSCRLR